MISPRSVLSFAFALLITPVALSAQEAEATPAPGTAPEAAPIASAAPAASVSVHELLVSALNKNLELQAKRLDPVIQGYRVKGAWGTYDPVVSLGGIYEYSQKPQNFREFQLSGSLSDGGSAARLYEEQNIRLQAGLSGRLPTGTQIEVANSSAKLENTSNRRPISLTSGSTIGGPRFYPEYQSSTTVTLTQPLLKDFGPSVNLAEVRLAKSAKRVSESELRGTVEKVLAQVLNASFETVFGQDNIRVKEQAIELAANLVRENQRRVDQGRMSPIEVAQAQARLAEAREELIIAQNFLAQRQNTLRELTRDEFVFDDPAFVISGDQLALPEPTASRDALVAAAFEHNPAYLAALETAKSEDIRIVYAKNQRLPRVDLRGTIGYTGLDKTWIYSYGDYKNREGPDWSAGVVVSMPLLGLAGSARVSESLARKRQAVYNIKRTEVELLSALDTVLRDIASARERRNLVKDTVRFATDALTAEEKRLSSGLTTSYNVANQLKEVSLARTRALAADVDLQKALTQLYLVQGVLSTELKVNIVTDETKS